MKHYYLIEKWDAKEVVPDGVKCIALTAEAMYELEKANIAYTPMENYYQSYKLMTDESEFLDRQLKWLDRFDQFIKDNSPKAKEYNLNLASVYCYWLMYMVDNFVLTSRVLKIFVEKEKPDRITYFSENFRPEKIKRQLNFRNTDSTYTRFIEPFCKKYRIEFQSKKINRKHHFGSVFKNGVYLSFRRKFALMMPESLRIKKRSVDLMNKCQNFVYHKNSAGQILALNFTDYMLRAYKELNESGINIYFKVGEKVVCFNDNGRSLIELNSFDKGQAEDCRCSRDTYARFKTSEIMGWISDECGVDVTSIAESRFKYFFNVVCPEVIFKTVRYLNFYKTHSISHVATHSFSTPDDYGAMQAAELMEGVERVGFAHGADAYRIKLRFYHLYRKFDRFFMSSQAEADFEEKLKLECGYDNPRFYHYDQFQNSYKSVRSARQNIHKEPDEIPKILYVPILTTPWPQRPLEKGQAFPMEYVQWHRSLLDYFASKEEYQFIWKAFYFPEQKFDLIQHLIEEGNYKNVKYDAGKLIPWLNEVDKVIVENPSTSFFECLYSGVPTLGLYMPEYQILSDTAQHEYKNKLLPFSTYKEGHMRIDKFLDDEPDEYIHQIKDRKNSLIECFQQDFKYINA